jgi:hypothetical protein
MDKRCELRTIYDDTQRHLHEWFPRLPSYGSFAQRLNQLADVFVPLREALQAQCPEAGVLRQVRLLDSMPIRLAHAKNEATVPAWRQSWRRKAIVRLRSCYKPSRPRDFGHPRK